MSGLLLAVHGMSTLFLARLPIVATSVLYACVCVIWLRRFMDWSRGVCDAVRTGPFHDCGIMAKPCECVSHCAILSQDMGSCMPA
jgi:hypothetical protein